MAEKLSKLSRRDLFKIALYKTGDLVITNALNRMPEAVSNLPPPFQITKETEFDVANASVAYQQGYIYNALLLCDGPFPAKAQVLKFLPGNKTPAQVEDTGFPDLGPNTRPENLEIFESPIGIHAFANVLKNDNAGSRTVAYGLSYDGKSWKRDFSQETNVPNACPIARICQAFVQSDGSWITNTHREYPDKATRQIIKEDWLYMIRKGNITMSARLAPEKPDKYYQTAIRGNDQLMEVFTAPSQQAGWQHLFIESISPKSFERTSELIEVNVDAYGLSLNPTECHGVFNPTSNNYDVVIIGNTIGGSAIALAEFRRDIKNERDVNVHMLTDPAREIVESARITADPKTGNSYIVYTCIERSTQEEKTYVLEPASGAKTYIPDSSTRLTQARIVNMNVEPLLDRFDPQNANLFVTGKGLFHNYSKTQLSGWRSR